MSKTIADPTLLATHMAELADKRIDILGASATSAPSPKRPVAQA